VPHTFEHDGGCGLMRIARIEKAITRIARDLEPDGGSCRQAHSIPDRA
jgi:hypothetical protein